MPSGQTCRSKTDILERHFLGKSQKKLKWHHKHMKPATFTSTYKKRMDCNHEITTTIYFSDLPMDDVTETDRKIFFYIFTSNNLGLIELSAVFFNFSHFKMGGEI